MSFISGLIMMPNSDFEFYAFMNNSLSNPGFLSVFMYNL